MANLRAAAEAGEKLSLASSKQASTQKIIIIVLGVLAAVLAVIILSNRYHSSTPSLFA